MLDFVEEFRKKYPKGAVVNYDVARDYGYGLTWRMDPNIDTLEKFRKDDGEYITFPQIQPYSTLTTDYHLFIIRYGVMYELERSSRENRYKIKRVVDEIKPRTLDKIFKDPSREHKKSANRSSEPIYMIERMDRFVFLHQNITRDEFFKLNEDDLILITNPGRQGDEDGSTFVMKKDDNYIVYRITGLMYGNKNDSERITIEEMLKQFPKWHACWDGNGEYKDSKYEYIYMGFGNGLSIDKRIYNKFYQYLMDEIKRNYPDESEIQYYHYFNCWELAFEAMANVED